MKLFFCFLVRTLVAFCFLPASTSGQQPNRKELSATPDQSQERSETLSSRPVRLPITVTDKKGQFVSGLSLKDFVIIEDKIPQQIDLLHTQESDTLPLYVAVVMHTSSSTSARLKFEQDAAMKFIQTLIGRPKNRVLFATFDDQVTLRQDFTDRIELLKHAVFEVRNPGEESFLFDAIWQLCSEKIHSAEGRRILVVITDGAYSNNRADIDDAIDIAQLSETPIFVVSTNGKADKELERLCDETGGTAFFAGDMLSLERSFSRISKESLSQYLIAYRPSNDRFDGSYRRVEVRLTNGQEAFTLRARRGYKAVVDITKMKYRQRNETLGGGGIISSYDRFRDETTVSTSVIISKPKNPKFEMLGPVFSLAASFVYSGQAKTSQPAAISLGFLVKEFEGDKRILSQRFSNPTEFIVLYDGQRYKSAMTASRIRDNGGDVTDVVVDRVPTSTFNSIVMAQKVEIRVGVNELVLTEGQLNALRALARSAIQ